MGDIVLVNITCFLDLLLGTQRLSTAPSKCCADSLALAIIVSYTAVSTGAVLSRLNAFVHLALGLVFGVIEINICNEVLQGLRLGK